MDDDTLPEALELDPSLSTRVRAALATLQERGDVSSESTLDEPWVWALVAPIVAGEGTFLGGLLPEVWHTWWVGGGRHHVPERVREDVWLSDETLLRVSGGREGDRLVRWSVRLAHPSGKWCRLVQRWTDVAEERTFGGPYDVALEHGGGEGHAAAPRQILKACDDWLADAEIRRRVLGKERAGYVKTDEFFLSARDVPRPPQRVAIGGVPAACPPDTRPRKISRIA